MRKTLIKPHYKKGTKHAVFSFVDSSFDTPNAELTCKMAKCLLLFWRNTKYVWAEDHRKEMLERVHKTSMCFYLKHSLCVLSIWLISMSSMWTYTKFAHIFCCQISAQWIKHFYDVSRAATSHTPLTKQMFLLLLFYSIVVVVAVFLAVWICTLWKFIRLNKSQQKVFISLIQIEQMV